MEDSDIYLKLSDKIDKLIDKLDKKFDALDHTLREHEIRIVVLEQGAESGNGKQRDWKEEVIGLLVKAVVIGAVSIASLVGASGILANIFGGKSYDSDKQSLFKNALGPVSVVCQIP